MARRVKAHQHHPIKAAKSALSRAAKKVSKRLRPARKRKDEAVAAAPRAVKPKKRAAPKASRRTRRQPDIPLELLDRAYIPKQTSLKSSFRTSGEERQRDQDYVETRWNDEDRLTNRSGDPRIGTHHRKYEPGE